MSEAEKSVKYPRLQVALGDLQGGNKGDAVFKALTVLERNPIELPVLMKVARILYNSELYVMVLLIAKNASDAGVVSHKLDLLVARCHRERGDYDEMENCLLKARNRGAKEEEIKKIQDRAKQV